MPMTTGGAPAASQGWSTGSRARVSSCGVITGLRTTTTRSAGRPVTRRVSSATPSETATTASTQG